VRGIVYSIIASRDIDWSTNVIERGTGVRGLYINACVESKEDLDRLELIQLSDQYELIVDA
jgi:hypothetical protein